MSVIGFKFYEPWSIPTIFLHCTPVGLGVKGALPNKEAASDNSVENTYISQLPLT